MPIRRAATCPLLILLLLVAGCPYPPVVLHDGLPAWAPPDRDAELRTGISTAYWSLDGDVGGPLPLVHAGFRASDDVGPLCIEGGAQLLYYVPSAHVGIGLRHPALMLRGSVTPPIFGGGTPWWQSSLLIGTGRNDGGFGLSFGPRASNLGLGLGLVGDWTGGGSSVRFEFSGTGRAPWAEPEVTGEVYTSGVWYARAVRNPEQRAIARRRRR